MRLYTILDFGYHHSNMKFQYFLYHLLASLLPYTLHNCNIGQPMIEFHLLTPQCNFSPSNASLLSQISNNSHAPCFLLSALSWFLSMQQSWNFLSLSVCSASFLCSCLSATESNTTKNNQTSHEEMSVTSTGGSR